MRKIGMALAIAALMSGSVAKPRTPGTLQRDRAGLQPGRLPQLPRVLSGSLSGLRQVGRLWSRQLAVVSWG